MMSRWWMVRVSLEPLDASIAMLDEFMWCSTHDLRRVRLDWRANDTKKQAIVACRCLPLYHLLHSSTSCDLFIPLYIKGPLVNHLILKIDLCGIIFANHHLRWPRCILLSLIFVTSQLPLSLGALTLLTWERHIFKADGHPMPEGKLKAQKEIMAPEIFMVHQVYGSTVDELCFLSPSPSF
jgi:hypothetical protein